MKKPRTVRGFFMFGCQNSVRMPGALSRERSVAGYGFKSRTWPFKRDLCRAALFFDIRPLATERSMAGTTDLYADAAAALSPFSMARTTFLMAVRTCERWLALRRRFFSA